MAYIWEKAKSILAANLNSGLSYLITTVLFNCELASMVLKVCFSFYGLLKGQHVFHSGTFLKN